MQFVALFVIIISLIAIAYRDLKAAMISLAAILLAALAFYYLSPNETAVSKKNAQFISAIELTSATISQGYADGFVLDLRIHNGNRDTTVQNLTVLSRLSDCGESQENCLVIGEDRSVIKLRVPPGQARDARVNLRIKKLNPIQGSPLWEHEIVGAR